ncbi:MAG: nitroreductase [Sphingobium sp.]
MLAVDQNAQVIDHLMQERRSIRGFLPTPVPQTLLDAIFATAQQAPSNCNVQPWVVHVVSGEAAERMRAALHDHAKGGADATPDFPLTGAYPGDYRIRQVDAAKALFAATGVERHDVEARTDSFLRNFRFFDAPHAAFIFIPEWAGMREAADVGMYAQSLMLALTANGLASCAQGALSHHADVVHRQLGVGPDLKLLFGLAFGYPDPEHPANQARTTRLPLDKAIIFHA